MRRPSWPAIAETTPFVLAIALRLLLPLTYSTEWGYDYFAHLHHIEYIAANHTLAPLELNNASYHPPLFYVIAALLYVLGLGARELIVLPVALGIARLSLLFYALRRFLPGDRLARIMAMTLAGVLPSALQLDGMLTNEALLGPLSLLALLILPRLISPQRTDNTSSAGTLRDGAWLGFIVGAMLLTKISALLVALLILCGVWSIGMTMTEGSWLRRVGPLLLALLLCALCALPHGLRARTQTGTMFPTAFETLPRFHAVAERALALPLLDRRPLGYVFGLSHGEIFRLPFASTSIDRFPVTLVASSFADYYNYGFAGRPRPGEPHVYINARPLPLRVLWLQRGAVVGGVLIALATIAAWVLCLRALHRRREHGLVVVLLLPLFALLGQLHFAIKYPIDNMGMVKGHYMQFAAAPLFALFGVAMSYLWRRSRPLFLVEAWALLLVIVYTLGTRRLIF